MGKGFVIFVTVSVCEFINPVVMGARTKIMLEWKSVRYVVLGRFEVLIVGAPYTSELERLTVLLLISPPLNWHPRCLDRNCTENPLYTKPMTNVFALLLYIMTTQGRLRPREQGGRRRRRRRHRSQGRRRPSQASLPGWRRRPRWRWIPR